MRTAKTTSNNLNVYNVMLTTPATTTHAKIRNQPRRLSTPTSRVAHILALPMELCSTKLLVRGRMDYGTQVPFSQPQPACIRATEAVTRPQMS